MEKEEQQLHLNNIIKGIEEVEELTRDIDYQEFQREEPIREGVYSNLQMVGQAAWQLSSDFEALAGLNFNTDILSGFRNARFNEEMEINHQMVWGIIENDLEIIRQEAMEASAQLGVPENE